MKYGRKKRTGKKYSKKSKGASSKRGGKSRAKHYNNYLLGNRGGVRL